MEKSKVYKFSDKADYIFYLSEMIINLLQRKEQIELRLGNAKDILDQNPKAKIVDSILYESISDVVIRPMQYIFNLLGDESKKAVSYKKYRKLLFANKARLGIKLEPLSDEEKSILNDFGQIRNWSLHIPESLYAEKKTFFKMTSEFVTENKSKIIVPKYINYEIKFLQKFKEETEDVLESINKILNRMTQDYKVLIGEDFGIVSETQHYKPYEIMNIVSNSWDAQTGKKK